MAHTPMHTIRTRRRYAALLAGCALGLVLAAMPQAALAQDVNKGFQGVGTVDAGAATFFTTDGGKRTNIDVTTPRAVITWKPDDPATSGTIDFLPEGYTGAFGSSTGSDYTVLNRILPGGTATIGINGTITSTVSGGDSQSTGGNVWFYTPNGFVVGPKAVIQVGGLVMTTNDISYSIDPASALPNFVDANGAVNFRGPDGSRGSIVNNGNISATSYIALVAPRIEQHGYVSAERSVAYVAAEQADLKINAGNFDIVIGQGTTDENGIVHDGTTTGSASTGNADQKAMRFVAVPKNTALTMLLSGGIGYTPAASVFNDGSAIVLSAGADGSPDGNIAIGTADFSNRLDAHATGDLTVAPTPPGPFSEGFAGTFFESFADLSGDKSVNLTAGNGTRIAAFNNLSLYSDSAAGGGAITLEAFPGGAFTSAGAIAITGYLSADASHSGDTSTDGTTGFDSQGGSVTLAADGGQISADYMYLYAGGYGGFGTKTGGDGFGGRIDIRAGFGGDVTTSYLSASARGDGGASYDFTGNFGIGGQGGVGTGGDITISDSSGSVDDDPAGGHLGFGSVYLDSSAVGGNSLDSGSGLGGDAFGGKIAITLNRQNQTFGFFDAHARAEDGDGGAVDPIGGVITMAVGGGIALALDSLHLDTGVYASVNSPAGAFGQGGTIDVGVTGDASVSITNDASLDSLAEVSPFFGEARSSPDLTGGKISLIADGGSFQAQNISVDVRAINTGADSSAGFAQGGSATVEVANGGSIYAFGIPESLFAGQLTIDATGTGSNGLAANSVAGGDITLSAESGGTITANSLFGIGLYAEGNSLGSDATAGNGVVAQGGSIAIDAIGGTIASELYAAASGYGGSGDGNGGAGTGGSIAVSVTNGGGLTGYFLPEVYGIGGSSLVKGDGGDGRGGGFTFESDSTAVFTDFSLDAYADGEGGNAASGLGGDGYGGGVQVDVIGGTHSWNFAFLTGRGEGGISQGSGSLAGSGYGSVDGLDFNVGGGASLTLGDFIIDAGASAGVNGEAGAAGKGGAIAVAVTGGASLDISGTATLNSLAEIPEFSGTVTNSPDLTGGNVSLLADNGEFEANNILVDVSAENVGADVSAGFAQGGDASVRAANGGVIAAVPIRLSEGDNGALRVEAEGYGTGGTSANLVTGGNITLASETGATIAAGSGTIELYARGEFGIAVGGQATGVIAQGGGIKIDALGGTIATSISADAGAQGGDADNSAGSGAGGTIDVRVLGGTLVSSLYASTQGYGGFTYIEGDGGDGTGGRLTLTSDAAATFTDFGLSYYASGQGGATYFGTGGDGHGGSAQIDVIGGTHNWYNIYLDGSARGASSYGEGSFAGSAFGAEDGLDVHFGGGAQMTLSYLDLNARAYAGGDGNGNVASGGTATLLVDQLASLTADSIGIDATGRMDFEERDPRGYITTPDGSGGTASAVADNGTITTPFLTVVANGMTGGAQTTAGIAAGGIAEIGSSAGGLIDIVGGVEGTGGLTLEARGLGAEGPSAADASGGIATLYTAGGAIASVFDIVVNADGDAGDFADYFASSGPANGHDALGGIASVEMRSGGVGGAISAPSITVTADGLANQIGPVLGAGGIGSGGIASIDVEQGTLTTGAISISGDGIGGEATERFDAGAGFASGSGEGGIVDFNLYGGTVHTTSIYVSANGTGASGFRGMSGATGSLPGTGTGGVAGFTATGGVLDDTGGLLVETQGSGGGGAFNPDVGPGGDGADGIGGVSSFDASGAASLGIADTIRIAADGQGGFAGSSFDGVRGAGGKGEGGIAAMTLADLAFELGAVDLSATGVGGFGDTGGTGSGGIASFTLDDSSGTNTVTPRTIENLFLGAAGFDARENLSIGGQARLFTDVNSPDAGLAITNNLTLYADGLSGANGLGAQIDISGAPVTVGGALDVTTPRDALFTVASGDSLDVTGNLDVLVGRALVSSGAISTAANARVIANDGITMTDLSVGGATLLQAINGPVVISNNLQSTGPVTVLGKSVSIFSLGGLSVADADATAGDLAIETAGDLLLATVDATGAVTLTSNGGSIHNTGAVNGIGIFYTAAGNVQSDAALASGGALGVDAGGTFSAPGTVSAVGDVSLSADFGLALSGVVSGGTTLLRASDGSLSVGSLISPGLVTAQARSVTIGSPGALRFAQAEATAGDLSITTAGNLAVFQGDASGGLALTSTGGRVSSTGSLASGGNSTLSSSGDIALATLTSGAGTSLTSANGAVGVADLNSAGSVTASGRSVTIGSSGALTFAGLDASAGNVSVQTAGNLTVNTVDAVDSITLTSTGGALDANGALDGDGITLSSLADLQLTSGVSTPGALSLTSSSGSVSASAPISSGGNIAVSGNSGITLGIASSGGTTSLTAANGAVSVSELTSAGAVTALGRSVAITSSGSLTFVNAQSTAGNLSLATTGDLALAQAGATGSVALSSANGSVNGSGPISAGGNVTASGKTGVAFGELSSGGTTTLTAANGAIGVGALTANGAVTASGSSIDLRGPGSLSVSEAQASAGDLVLQAGDGLTVATASASGSAALSAGGELVTSGLVEAAGISLDATNVTVGGQVHSSGGLEVFANQLFTLNGSASGTGIEINSGDIAIGSTGRLGSRGLTQSIALRNRDSGDPMNIGGTGQEGQYSVDKDEVARLFADEQISFIAQAGEGVGGDVNIGDFALAYGDEANIGSGGLLKVDAGGTVQVTGAVALTTVSDEDGFSIDPTRINVIAGEGSIVMHNAAGDLQGTLELQADTIGVADQATLDTIDGLTDFTAITGALDTPGSAGPDGGYLQAGTINLIVGDALFIQNGGATKDFDDRRGFLANALNIESESSAPQIAINGVIRTPTGDLIGLDTSAAVSINGVFASELPSSVTVTINGCNTGIDCGRPPFSYGGLSSDDLELVLTAGDESKSGPTGQLVQLQDNRPLITPPLVDEPITGVGNDDLWQVKCAPESDKGSCPVEEGTE